MAIIIIMAGTTVEVITMAGGAADITDGVRESERIRDEDEASG